MPNFNEIDERFDERFNTEALTEPMIKIAIDGLLLKIKAFVHVEVSRACKNDRKKILKDCASFFHPYCGEPSCYEKLTEYLEEKL